MQNIKIGIVEDEVIIADSIACLLGDLGYNTCEPTGNYDEALAMIETEKPDILLLDIHLNRSRSGIEIAEYLRKNYKIPFIFLTANSDAATLDRAKKARPNAYLVKPFQKVDLYVAIEIALYNFNHGEAQSSIITPTTNAAEVSKDWIFIKDGQYMHKVQFDDILHLSSDHVYVTVHTRTKKFLVRASMQEYLSKLDSRFLRVHRSYAVNVDKIDKINSVYLVVAGEQLPISKNHRDNLTAILQAC